MYKHASQNLQHAARAETTKNEGIDDQAFSGRAAAEKRTQLTQRLRDIESGMRHLRESITASQRRGDWNGVAKWQRQRSLLGKEMQQIQLEFGKLNERVRSISRSEDIEKEKRFERNFLNIAKELLAEPIFARIVKATLHRMGEEDDERSSSQFPG
jgi:hypothetical protein